MLLYTLITFNSVSQQIAERGSMTIFALFPSIVTIESDFFCGRISFHVAASPCSDVPLRLLSRFVRGGASWKSTVIAHLSPAGLPGSIVITPHSRQLSAPHFFMTQRYLCKSLASLGKQIVRKFSLPNACI